MASTNPITLSDYALMSNSPLVQKFSYGLITAGSILQDLPMKPYKSMKALGSRFLGAGLATVGSRALNADPVSTKSVPSAYSENAYIISNNFDVDRVFIEDINSIQDPMATQFTAYTKALSYWLNDKFINNDHISTSGDTNAIVGLKYRLDNAADYQIPGEMKIDASCDLSGAISPANANKFLEVLDQTLQYLGDSEGNGVVLYCNDLLKRKINTAIRSLGPNGGFSIAQDQFGRQVEKYRAATIRDLGRKADQVTRIISPTETNTGAQGNSNYTSLYGVKYSLEGDGLYGWEFRSMEEAFSQPFLLNNGTQMRTNFDYPVGIFQESIRAITRVYDIKVS